ncbi:Uncharacterised protein [Vibrio cholerae]|nr:Uncharacterised protein [Vibrio cholerae]
MRRHTRISIMQEVGFRLVLQLSLNSFNQCVFLVIVLQKIA